MLDEDRAALIGPIVTEILQGISRESQANYVSSLLRGLQIIELSWNDWVEAARLGRRLAGSGDKLPLSDLVLAAVAGRLQSEVYTSDPHFDLLPEVKRFSPAA